MQRTILFVLCGVLVLAGRADAGPITLPDPTRYPATFLLLAPDEEINNGASVFTQTGTTGNIGGLNLIVSGHPWPIPPNATTDVGPTFTGKIFGVYKDFTGQYESFLGTTGDSFQPTGLVVVLAPGVGQGKTFNEVFGPGYSEAELIDALVRFRLGDTSGFLLMYDLMSGSLAKQPTFTQVGPDSYELGPAELIRFSTGTSIGEVVSGGYQIPHTQAVPEPSSLVIGLLSIATLIGIRRSKLRVVKPS